MRVNPLHLLRALAKGTNPIAMPDGRDSDKKTMRLVLLAIVASVDNDTQEIPAEYRVPMANLAADVGHKAAARALNTLEAAQYIVIDRPTGHGAKIGIRLGPKLADPNQWVYLKKAVRNDQAQGGRGDQAKPLRRRKEPVRNDQAQDGRGDQAQDGRGDQAPIPSDQAQDGRGDEASPYVSTLVSTQSEKRLLGEESCEDPYEQYTSVDPYEDHEDPIQALRRTMLPDPEVESEVRALRNAIQRYFRERRSKVPGCEDPLVEVLLVSRTDSIAKLPPVDVASIPDHVWERARHPKPLIAKSTAA